VHDVERAIRALQRRDAPGDRNREARARRDARRTGALGDIVYDIGELPAQAVQQLGMLGRTERATLPCASAKFWRARAPPT
jgi:hypothetical protein